MKTELIKVRIEDENLIKEAAKLLKSGDLVAFPTETVYGLGANALDESACQKLYEVKGRPENKAISLLVADRKMIEDVAIITPLAEKLIEKFFPGPLTLILPKLNMNMNWITGKLSTIGVRMPDNEIAISLIKNLGNPIAAPSANLSGEPAPTTAEEVYKNLNGKIKLILDGGACTFGISSTIVDATGKNPVVLRQGSITIDD